MFARTAIAVMAAVACFGAPNAWAVEATATAEPGEPGVETALVPLETPDNADGGPVDVILDLGGLGTDSRAGEVPVDALEVRWHFTIVGAPPGTPLHVWAQFAAAGEIEAVGTDAVTVVTPGHDTLIDGMSSALLPQLAEGVEVRLVGVEVVPRPAQPPASRASGAAHTRTASTTAGGEPFLPFTGPREQLLVLAAAFAAFGAALRLVPARARSDMRAP